MEEGQEPEVEPAVDVAELWLDAAVTGEMLAVLDPLDITYEMVEAAEHPELADFVFRSIPVCQMSEGAARLLWNRTKSELQARHGGKETARAFVARLTGSS